MTKLAVKLYFYLDLDTHVEILLLSQNFKQRHYINFSKLSQLILAHNAAEGGRGWDPLWLICSQHVVHVFDMSVTLLCKQIQYIYKSIGNPGLEGSNP